MFHVKWITWAFSHFFFLSFSCLLCGDWNVFHANKMTKDPFSKRESLNFASVFRSFRMKFNIKREKIFMKICKSHEKSQFQLLFRHKYSLWIFHWDEYFPSFHFDYDFCLVNEACNRETETSWFPSFLFTNRSKILLITFPFCSEIAFCLVNFFSVASFSSQRRSHCPHLISALSSRHSPWKWKLFTFCFVLKSDNAVPRRQRRRWEQRDKSAEEISAFNFHKRYDFVAFHISFPSTTDNFSLITKGNFKVIVIKKFHF